MSNETAALILSIVSLAGTAFSVWLKQQIRLDIQAVEKAILDQVDGKYVTRREMEQFDRRLQSLEPKRPSWT